MQVKLFLSFSAKNYHSSKSMTFLTVKQKSAHHSAITLHSLRTPKKPLEAFSEGINFRYSSYLSVVPCLMLKHCNWKQCFPY